MRTPRPEQTQNGAAPAPHPKVGKASPMKTVTRRGAKPPPSRLKLALDRLHEGDFSVRLTNDADVDPGVVRAFNALAERNLAFCEELSRVGTIVRKVGGAKARSSLPKAAGAWKACIDTINVIVDDLAGPMTAAVRVLDAVTRGDLVRGMPVDSHEDDVGGEYLRVARIVNRMVDQLKAFASEVTRVAREVGTEGKLGGQAEVKGAAGTWNDLTHSVNSMAANLTSQVRNIAHVTTAVARGDLSTKISVDARGEILELKNTVNTMVDQLNAFASEVTRVAREVGTDGVLGGQADVEGVAGTWKDLTVNVNGLAANLTTQVRAIAEVAMAVAEGDLTRSISVEARGEVASLKDSLNGMIRNLKETTRKNTRQEWLNSNLARFGRMLQGQRDLDTVSRMVLAELAPLISSQAALFYVLDGDKHAPRLSLRAAYAPAATDALGGVSTVFRLGEGMVGQCAVERARILVGNVPPGYSRISSGLGAAPPANLAILPVLFEGRIKAVVELASLEPFSETQLAFLDQLMESLGIVLNTIEATSQTEDLLRQSQSMTGRLKAQQEELQRSNEELEQKALLLTEQKVEVEAKNREVERGSAALGEKAAQLALASKYKSEFLANMSHELRTPLNSLLILAKLLADDVDGNLTSKQIEFAETIYSSGRDLLSLINEILDLSKIESGTMAVDLGEVFLADIGDFAERGFRQVADDKGLSFELRLDPGLRASVRTDTRRLQQVLRNLLSNAFKFTARGGVVLHIHGAGEGSGPHLAGRAAMSDGIAFSVSDTGIGIPEEKHEIIFDAFQQADGTTSRRFGGTGLGLSISREIARILGGSIGLSSTPGTGSTFTLYLPGAYVGSTIAPGKEIAGLNGPPAAATRPIGPEEGAPLAASPTVASCEPETYDDDRGSICRGDAVLLVVDRDAERASAVIGLARRRGLRCIVSRRADTILSLARAHRPCGLVLSADLASDPHGPGLARISQEAALRDVPWHLLWDGRTPPSGDFGLRTYAATPLTREALLPALNEIAAYRGSPVRTAVVVARDDASHGDALALLAAKGVATTTTSLARDSIVTLRAAPPDVAIIDLGLKGAEALIATIRREHALRRTCLLIMVRDARPHTDVDAAIVARIGGDRDGGLAAATLRTSDVATFLDRIRPQTVREDAGEPLPSDRVDVLANRCVMVVDDDVRNVFAITSMLERQQLVVRYATNGPDAIEAIAGTPGIDVVLMDIMMPGMDGYETIRTIRKDARFASLPIVAVTAKAMAGDREKCLEAGASDYITKPVDSDQLLSLLRVWLSP